MIAVIDYGIGNLGSARKALVALGAEAVLASRPEEAEGARGMVLPGVGAFGRSMQALEASGLKDTVMSAIGGGVPFLGICVGFQMLFEGSDESPGVEGLCVLPGRVLALPEGQKRPQMQWNALDRSSDVVPAMLEGVGKRPWVYFVHSFAPVPDGFIAGQGGGGVVATCDYGGTVVASVEAGPVWGVQFHPEKSGKVGLAILENFVRRCRG